MLQFVIRRLLIAIPILVLASILSFVLVANSGDPLEALRGRPNSQQAIAQKIAANHLDQPVLQRYFTWAGHFIRGDFGKDSAGQPVKPQLFRAMWITLRLVLAATLIAITLGVCVGVISAVRQYSAFDYGSTFLAFLFFSMPVFWFAVLLKQFGAIKFNNWLHAPSISWVFLALFALVGAGVGRIIGGAGERGDRRRGLIGAGIGLVAGGLGAFLLGLWLHGHQFSRWIATVGPESPNFRGSFLSRIGDYAGHMVLPTITLAIISFATYSRYQRASMLDTLTSDYVRTARAKGLSNRRVILRHAVRTALIPVATLMAIDFGALLAGAIITESIFAWKGMGSLFITALLNVDPNTALAYLMVTAMMVIIFNILADIAYAYLDPRIRVD
jgi:peptide/nickel transport system permease protein